MGSYRNTYTESEIFLQATDPRNSFQRSGFNCFSKHFRLDFFWPHIFLPLALRQVRETNTLPAEHDRMMRAGISIAAKWHATPFYAAAHLVGTRTGPLVPPLLTMLLMPAMLTTLTTLTGLALSRGGGPHSWNRTEYLQNFPQTDRAQGYHKETPETRPGQSLLLHNLREQPEPAAADPPAPLQQQREQLHKQHEREEKRERRDPGQAK